MASALLVVVVACGPRSLSLTSSPPAQPATCDSVVARSAADPAQHVDEEPRAHSLFLPPQPVPRPLKGHIAVVEFVVDPEGRPTRIAVSGLFDQDYSDRLRIGMQRTRFTPARRGDCGVFGVMRLSLKL
jgi:hypothetical protein